MKTIFIYYTTSKNEVEHKWVEFARDTLRII